METIAQLKTVKVKLKANTQLAGREHSAAAPARFNGGDTAEIDEETAKASPWAFEPVDPAVKALWEQERQKALIKS